MAMWCLGLLFLVPLQDPSVRDLIERMKGEDAGERNHAFTRLRSLGRIAEPELRAAAGDADSELAARSRMLLRGLELRRTVSPRILAEFPDLPERAAENPEVWVETLLEAAEWTSEELRRHPRLQRSDLGELAREALPQARTPAVREAVLEVIGAHRLRAALPEVHSLLHHPNYAARRSALNLLRTMRDPESVTVIASMLENEDLSNQATWVLIQYQRASVVPALRDYFDHPSPWVRAAATLALRNTDKREALPLLVSRLQDPDPNNRSQALHELVRTCGAIEALPHLRPLLAGDDPQLQALALSALNGSACPEVWPWIRPLLKSETVDVRRGALSLTAELRTVDVIDDLVALLQDPVPDLRAGAAQALAGLRYRDAIPEIVRQLADPSELVREGALKGLAALGVTEILPHLLGRLKHPNPGVRRQTLDWLAHRRWREGAAAVAELLEDPDCQVRTEAIATLSRMRARSQVPRLLSLLKNLDPTAEAASYALRQWDIPEVRDGLIELTRHPDAAVRCWAAGTLTWRPSAETGPIFLRLLDDPDERVRDEAIAGVGRLKLREGLPTLRTLLITPARGNVRGAAFALVAMQDWDSLGDLLGTELRSSERSDLIDLLEAWKSPDLVAPLERFLDDDDRHTRESTLGLFRRLNHPLATEAIRRVLRIDGHPLISACTDSLGRLEDRESIPDLLRLLDDRSENVRVSAAQALALLGAREAIPVLMKRYREESDTAQPRFLGPLSRLGAPDLAPEVLRMLRGEDPNAVATGIYAAQTLRLAEALPDLVRLTQDDDLNLRPLASRALIRLGDRGEIARLLEREPRYFYLLNRFREPDFCDRLRRAPQPRTYRGTYLQALTDFAADAGLVLETNGQEEFLEEELSESVLHRNGVSTLLDALDEMLGYRHVSYFLDSNRLSLLPAEDVQPFWSLWAKQQGLR